MKNLPKEYQSEIQSNMTVLWWDRRAFYEVVEELSSAIWWSIVALLISYHIVIYYPKMVTWQWSVAMLIVFFYLWYHAVIEIQIWMHEIYVVCHDAQTGEGKIYKFFAPVRNKAKFWQVWNRDYIPEPISPISPTPMIDKWWFYRFWGKITGEQMMRISLKGINGTFLDGRRISPNIMKAINQVRAYKPVKGTPRDSNGLGAVYDLGHAKSIGLLKAELAEELYTALATRIVYGGGEHQ